MEFNNLAGECREVLKNLMSTTSEVHTSDGKWYLKRIMPYRTAENTIEGVVITFVNIGYLKEAEEAGKRARAYFAAIVDTVREPLVVLSKDLRVVSANRAFYHVFRTTLKQTEGELIYELGMGQWDIPKLRQLLEEILPKDARFEDFEVEVEIPKLGRRTFALNARRLEQPTEEGSLILLALEDMTSR
jgi:two-component system CheB/CheR fusion protein